MSITSRNNKIDFLRGIAILLVLLLHFNISYSLDQSALKNIFSISFIQAIASNGNYGVTIFFVISGFLITTTTFERYGPLGKIDPVAFYIFRFARIIPCLLLALSIIMMFSLLHIKIFQNDPNSTSYFLTFLSVLTFWHNILMEKVGYFNYCLNIYWSLSVEEIFYFSFPILCLFLKRTKFILLFLITIAIISPIYRSHYKENEIIALYGYLSCFDAIALGCIAAIISQKIKFSNTICRILLFFSFFFMAVIYFYSGIMNNVVIGISLMAISASIFLISASAKQEPSNHGGLFSQIVCWFGKHSYELYLFHIIVLALMKEMMNRDVLGNYTKLLWLTVFLGISAIVAVIISKFYSEPMNTKLRRYLLDWRHKKFSPSFSLSDLH